MSTLSDKKRITFLMLGYLALGCIVSARAVHIQLFKNDRLEKMAKRQFQSKVLIRPRRGIILDRNGEPLAVNVDTQSLAANPSKVTEKYWLAKTLGQALDLPSSKILERFREKKEFVWIKRHLSENETKKLKKLRIIDSDGDLSEGLWLVRESQRTYPHGELAAHVLGSVNIDAEGLEGLELQYNESLRGKVVSVSAIRDALRRPSFIDAVAAKDVVDGSPLNLTLDASLQFSVEELLKASTASTGSKSGTVIVMDATSGEILALANRPTFNPNDSIGGHLDKRRNRAITDGYEPGSTMKSVLAASALSNGWGLNSLVWGERGTYTVQKHRISEAESHEKFEWLSLKKLLQVSSNIGAAKVALKLGGEKYLQTLQSFEFGSKTGTGFPGELGGQVPPLMKGKRPLQPLSLANLGFGQGLLATPIQVTRAYAAFLNGGWLVRPTLVKPTTEFQIANPPKKILSTKVSEQVLQALETVTQQDGTGIKAALPGYRVAGKTGTAQKVDPGKNGYAKGKYFVSFVGFPIDVEHKLVIYVGLEDPQGIYYASHTAAPLFKEVLNAVVTRFSIPARSTGTLAQTKDQVKVTQAMYSKSKTEKNLAIEKIKAEAEKETLNTPVGLKWSGATKDGRFVWVMPSLEGLTAREAIQKLKGHNLKIEVRGIGLVRTQFPEAGKSIADTQTVRLSLNEN
jgi:cell division protein FtsI (penicillin-binding protein 3)